MRIGLILLIFLSSLFLFACGGSGGGGSSSSSSSAMNWTTSGTSFGPTVYFRNSASTVSSGTNNVCMPSLESCNFGGADATINASTDSITFAYEGGGSPDINSFEFPASSIISTVTTADINTLGSTNYTYSKYDVANGETHKIMVMVPKNYSYQYWIYWDTTHITPEPSAYYYHETVMGTEFTPFTSLPSSGTSTYTGGMEMSYGLSDASKLYSGAGDVSLTANWANSTISGSMTGITITEAGVQTLSFPNISMASVNIVANTGYELAGGGNPAYFVGYLTYSGYSSAWIYEWGSIYNRIYGYFYGPAYNEIGGVFGITSTSGAEGGGYFAAKR